MCSCGSSCRPDGTCSSRRCPTRRPTPRLPSSSQNIPAVRPEGPSCIACAAALPGEAKFCPHCGEGQQRVVDFFDDEPTVVDHEPLRAMRPPPPDSRRGTERIPPKRSDTFEKPDISPAAIRALRERKTVS